MRILDSVLYMRKCDGVPIVANTPGAAACLDTPVMFSIELYYS